jgi:hypothetical protein
VRELTRVALPETEAAWVDWAMGKTVAQVEKQVSGRQPGDRPSDPQDPARIKHRLSFEVRAETLAMVRELQAALREELGGDVDDDLILHEIVRRAMGGEDEGRAPYQVAVARCDTCQIARIDAAGESFPIDAVVEDMIDCDAQVIPHAIPHVIPQVIPHMGDSTGSRPRATQTVPPATRREVMRRGRKVCAVPGCRNHRHLHVHHVKPRSEGGDHDPAFLVPLCHRHHTQVHDGTLVITGSVDDGFTFRHADGASYGAPRAASVELAQQVFATLRAMGFRMTEAQRLVDRVQRAGPPETLEAFVRAALVACGT